MSNDGRKIDPRVEDLRKLFRGLLVFRAFYESDGICEITVPGTQTVWSLFDIEYLYARAMRTAREISPVTVSAHLVWPGWFVQRHGVWTRVEQTSVSKSGRINLHMEPVPQTFNADAKVTALTPELKRAWDFEQANPCLPPGQQRAIELFLVQNMFEADAAELMGVSRTNPVGMYATSGLSQLLRWIDDGMLPNFKWDAPDRLPEHTDVQHAKWVAARRAASADDGYCDEDCCAGCAATA